MAYDLKTPNVPRLAGVQLKLVAKLAQGPLGGVVWRAMAGNIGLHTFRAAPAGDAPLAPLPVLPPGRDDVAPPDLEALADAPSTIAGDAPPTVADYRRAYREGTSDPVKVAERVIEAIRASEQLEPKLRLFIAHDPDDVMRQAKEAKARWDKGELLGPLDGVPVAIKDEVDLVGYPTTQGTAFLGARGKPAADATSAAGLRATGALLLGKANMTEIGINPIGHQPHHGTPRNPYDEQRFTGGSSSGPGAAVASGICPIALGADGGGSIRNPASFCGTVGLKATFGRVSEHGVPPICWSVGHIGPLAASARDCALGYAAMAGPDPHDLNTLGRPGVDLDRLDDGDLSDLTLGVYPAWFDDADPGVVKACRAMLETLKAKGAKVKEIEVEGLDTMRVAHLITIASEMLAAQRANLGEHLHQFAPDVQLLFANIERFRADDYVHAQRHRHLICQRFDKLLKEVDVIVTPTNGCTAPPIRPDALGGESDLSTLSKVMRFVVAANMTGLPAISFPCGYDDDGLPVGFQAMGRAWEESTLLRMAAAVEGDVERRRPKHFWSLLG
jgi:Asp-tRNA(Asn)/Glu-tRNA(Gln) amidotransferase A subunit family amidase